MNYIVHGQFFINTPTRLKSPAPMPHFSFHFTFTAAPLADVPLLCVAVISFLTVATLIRRARRATK